MSYPQAGGFLPTEDSEQEALFEWAAMMSRVQPCLRLLHHIPNGGKRDIGTARALRRRGVKPGVPDLCLPHPAGRFHGLYIELKKAHGGRTSDYQDEWIKALEGEGYFVAVCHGWRNAATKIEEYLKLENSGVAEKGENDENT